MRQWLRFPLLFLVSLALLGPALATRALELLGGERAALRSAAAVQRLWARAMLRALGVEVRLEGESPRAGTLVVANHLSYLDILVLAAHVPGRFVAKSEIAGWPGLGQLARSVGTIWVVQRKRMDVLRVDGEMARTLAAGVSVLLFPEGHSTGGVSVDRLHSSLLDLAARERLPCHAVSLSYETPGSPWAPAATVCWWGGMTFGRHAWDLVGLPRIVARVRPAPAPRTGLDRKRLAGELQRDLLERHVPVRQTPLAPDYPWPQVFAGQDVPCSAPVFGPGPDGEERGR